MIDCNNCRNINMTEDEQTDNKKNHYCTKYNTRVLHNGEPYKIFPCIKCVMDMYREYDEVERFLRKC